MKPARPDRVAERQPEGNRPEAPVHQGNDNPASDYIRDNYRPEHRLAVVVINKRTGATVQRIASAESIASQDSLRWLRHMNNSGYEVYLSANALREGAKSRTKNDVGEIRHLYLDIDREGDEVLARLLARSDLPQPNYVVTTSPGKYQTIWKVEGFSREQAEDLQRWLARQAQADIAVTDSSRVLRLPGFYNHKYDPPHLVEAREVSRQVQTPENFSKVREAERQQVSDSAKNASRPPPSMPKPLGRITQSERDWAYARRALSRGDNPEVIVSAIASYRRYDKHNPRQYAERTVDKALQSLGMQWHDSDAPARSPER